MSLELIYVNFTLAREHLELEFFGRTQNTAFTVQMTLLGAIVSSKKHLSQRERAVQMGLLSRAHTGFS